MLFFSKHVRHCFVLLTKRGISETFLSTKKKRKKKDVLLPFNALLGYIGTATSKGMKWRMIVLSDIR